jgi:hypothetical protein
MRLSTKILAGAVSAAMLLAAPTAFAQTSATQGYSSPGGVVQTQLGHSPSQQTKPSASTSTNTPSSPSTPAAVTQTSAKSSSKLPFTGLDLALVVAAGGLLLAMGLGIRRLSRSTEAT